MHDCKQLTLEVLQKSLDILKKRVPAQIKQAWNSPRRSEELNGAIFCALDVQNNLYAHGLSKHVGCGCITQIKKSLVDPSEAICLPYFPPHISFDSQTGFLDALRRDDRVVTDSDNLTPDNIEPIFEWQVRYRRLIGELV